MNLICETLVYAKKNYYLCKRKRERKRAPRFGYTSETKFSVAGSKPKTVRHAVCNH